MWVREIEIIKQLGVKEVKTTATVIIYGISGTRDIEICVKVMVMTFLERAEL